MIKLNMFTKISLLIVLAAALTVLSLLFVNLTPGNNFPMSQTTSDLPARMEKGNISADESPINYIGTPARNEGRDNADESLPGSASPEAIRAPVPLSSVFASPELSGSSQESSYAQVYAIDRREVLAQLPYLYNLLIESGGKEVVRDGETIGVQLNDVQPNSFFEAAGLKTGDIIMAVNGQAAKSPVEMIKIIQTSQEEWLDLEIEREGKIRWLAVATLHE